MPRRSGLPSVYAAAAAATAVATAASLATTPASGTAGTPFAEDPTAPYIVVATDRAAARALAGEGRWRVRRYFTAVLPGFAAQLTEREATELRGDRRVRSLEPDDHLRTRPVRRGHRASGRTVYVIDGGVDVIRRRAAAWRALKDPDGERRVSDVIAGLDWVRAHARGRSLAVMPVSTGNSPALRAAVRRLVRSGVDVAGGPQNLEFHHSALASWLKSTTARGAIRQNPSRTLLDAGEL